MSNSGGVYTWSKTATANAGADMTVNYAEGQAPSSLNDSARNAMASVAKYRDDISGALVTTGTSAAYQVASNQAFDTLANFHGQMIAFTPHVTNAAGPVTMTVDGFANLPLRSSPGKELLNGVLVQGTPYLATYNNTDGSLYLHNFYGASPYLVPIGGMIDYIGATAPNSSFVLPFGQAISRTTYASLFALTGTTFGTGDGSTTFNVPDLRGRVVAGYDNMGGPGAGRLNGSLWSNVGGQTTTLNTTNLPPYTPSGSVSTTVTGITLNTQSASSSGANVPSTVSLGNSGGSATGAQSGAFLAGTASSTLSMAAQGGANAPISVLQPTAILNKLIRVI